MQQREGLENRLVAEAVYNYKGKHNTKTICFFVTLKFLNWRKSPKPLPSLRDASEVVEKKV